MADNSTTPASGGLPVASDDIGGVQHQRIKVEFGADGTATEVSPANPLPAAGYGVADGGFVPDPHAVEPALSLGVAAPLRLSEGGELVVRATVSTDEGHLRHDFPGAALTTTLTGGANITLTAASTAMTGVGSAFLSQLQRGVFVKLNADAETAWAQVQSVESDTAATLVVPYTGTGGTGAGSWSTWDLTTGSGGSFAVSSSILTIASGTTIAARTNIWRTIDYSPVRATFLGVSASQRIANQVAYVGLRNLETSPTEYAEFQFDGTTNTTVKCVTSSDGAVVATTTVTLPNVGATTTSGTSATATTYDIEVLRERVTFYISGQIVATHDTHVPNSYTNLGVFVGWINGGSAPATSSNLTLDDIFIRNTSIVQIGADMGGNPLPVELRPSAELLVQARPLTMTATNNVVIVQLNGRASQLALELTGTFTGTVTFEALFSDQGVWSAHTVYVNATTGVTTATAVGRWMVPCAGLRAFRVRSSTSGTGAANVSMQVAAAGNTVVQLGTSTASIGAVTVTSTTALTPGTAAANLGKAEDAVAASGDTGVFVLAVQRAAPASNVSATGDYAEFQVSPANGLFTAPMPVVVDLVATPTISNGSIYAAGDQVGGVMTFTGAALASGRAFQIVESNIRDHGKQTADLELWLYKVSPTLVGSDNAAFDITDGNTNTALPVGVFDFLTANYRSTASNSFCKGVLNGGPSIVTGVTSASANLFGVLVTRDTPTYTSTSDLVVTLTIMQF